MKHLYAITMLFFSCLGFLSAQTISESMPHDGQTRWYRVHLPPDYHPDDVLPCVLNFHGLGSNAQEQEILFKNYERRHDEKLSGRVARKKG